MEQKISIGLPIYNGEQFIHKRLESILSQTYTDFELIISDNASTDSTSDICKEFEKQDKRIRYVRQEKNMGAVWNFKFVLKEAKYDFFVWASIDDMWSQDFLKMNIEILLSNENIVCSLGKVIPYNMESNKISPIKSDFIQKHSVSYIIKHLIKKILLPKTGGTLDTYSISGTYEQKVKLFLKYLPGMVVYGVYRTWVLRETMKIKLTFAYDLAMDLTILKHGDVHVIDKDLMFFYTKGTSNNISSISHEFNINRIKSMFIWMPFTLWSVKNLGFRIFVKNLDQFILLNYIGITMHLLNFYVKYIKQPRLSNRIKKERLNF